MAEKKNQLWRLDVLEAHFLNKPVRYQRTKSLLRVKGKNKANLFPESKERALQEIEALKSDVFAKKLHSSLIKYNRSVKKTIKTALTDKKYKEDEKKFLQSLDAEKISNIRIVKLTSTIFKLNAKKLSSEPESSPGFIPKWIIDALVDKSADLNPSRFYNEMSNEQRNWYSKLMNHKDIQSIVDVIENSFKIVLGAVKKADDIEDVETSESEDDKEEKEKEAYDSEADSEDSDNEEQDIDDDDFSMYDKYLAGTDDEDDESAELDPTIDYNQITDEEPSDEEEAQDSEEELPSRKKGKKEAAAEVDDFFDFEADEKPKKEKKTKEDKKKQKDDKKKKKTALPELQGGFISGSDESDFEEDKVVQEITGGVKKNRRGQRARQKIWEQKFGRGANHVRKEKDERKKISEQKQREWEEREAKRQAKAAEMTGSNSSKLGVRKALTGDGKTVAPPTSSVQALHPSWEAKKKQEAALKNTKFQGKKVVF